MPALSRNLPDWGRGEQIECGILNAECGMKHKVKRERGEKAKRLRAMTSGSCPATRFASHAKLVSAGE
jgi:hypothetical protein